MNLLLCYGLGCDKNSDGNGLRHLGELVSKRWPQALVEICVVPNAPKLRVGVAAKPFWVLGQSAGAGAAEDWAMNASIPIDYMGLAVPYPILKDGKLIDDVYDQSAWVSELATWRLAEGFLPGVHLGKRHNATERILPAILGQSGLEPHMSVWKRPEVIEQTMADLERRAKMNGIT